MGVSDIGKYVGKKGFNVIYARHAERYFKEHFEVAQKAHDDAVTALSTEREQRRREARTHWWRDNYTNAPKTEGSNPIAETERRIGERSLELQTDWARRRADLERQIGEEREQFRDWREKQRELAKQQKAEAKDNPHNRAQDAWDKEGPVLLQAIEEEIRAKRKEQDVLLELAAVQLDREIRSLLETSWKNDKVLTQRCWLEVVKEKHLMLDEETEEEWQHRIACEEDELARLEGKTVPERPPLPEKPIKAKPGVRSIAMENPAIRQSLREAIEREKKPASKAKEA